MNIILILWYFVIFSFLGWLYNCIYNLIFEKKFYNKGFLTSPFCPIYGFCAVVCYLAMSSFTESFLILFVGCSILLSLLVVIIGNITEKIIGCKPWDYSDSVMNIGSYITIPYGLLLGLLGAVLVYVIIPVLNSFLVLIPPVVSVIIVLSICLLILADYVLSIITTIRIQHRMKRLGNFAELLGDNVTKEELDELEKNYNHLFTEGILRRRMINAFPELKTSAYVKKASTKLAEIKEENMKEYTYVYDNKSEEPFAYGFCFVKLFYLFLIGSFLGTLIETVFALFAEGHFEVRVGLVYGPFIPVYGGGACFLTIVLYKLYKLSDTLIFVISAFVGATFEYFCSWFQEKLFGTVSWDYSNLPFNIGGRTSLLYALFWGFLGLVWVRYLYPMTSKLIEKLPKKIGSILTTVLLVFMIFNAFMTVTSIYRWQQRLDGAEPSNAFEYYLDNNFNNDKMKFLFPHMDDADTKRSEHLAEIKNTN